MLGKGSKFTKGGDIKQTSWEVSMFYCVSKWVLYECDFSRIQRLPNRLKLDMKFKQNFGVTNR